MDERQVTEFIIVPPFERRDQIARSKERLKHYLSNRFPGYGFRISGFVPVGEEDAFCVLPVMNFAGDDGRSYMCAPPKRWLLADIAMACRQFDRNDLRHCAA